MLSTDCEAITGCNWQRNLVPRSLVDKATDGSPTSSNQREMQIELAQLSITLSVKYGIEGKNRHIAAAVSEPFSSSGSTILLACGRNLGATISGMRRRCRLLETGWAEFGYFLCYFKMVAPRALIFRPLVKRNEALGTRLHSIVKSCVLILMSALVNKLAWCYCPAITNCSLPVCVINW